MGGKRYFASLLCGLSLISCSSKPSINDSDREYIQTTLDLMRVRSTIKPGVDSLRIKSMVDSVLRKHHVSQASYLKSTADLGNDPKKAELVYNVIRDSVGIK